MKFTVGTCGIIYVMSAFFLSMNLRTRYSEDEYNQRIFPVKKTLTLINRNDVIVTDIPLIFHLFANDHQIIVDAYSTSIERIQYYLNDKAIKNVYVLNRRDNLKDMERHPEYFKLLRTYKPVELKNISSSYELLKLTR
jgi:hypothetical protein